MTEQEIADGLMRTYPNMDRLIKAEDRYSYFDYENKSYLFEFKSRKSFFKTWIIEKEKLDLNQEIASNNSKSFIYLVEHNMTAYIWNVSKLLGNNYDFKFQDKLVPNYTDLDDRDVQYMKFKQVGFLCNKMASNIIYLGHPL